MTPPLKEATSPADMVFILADRQDRIAQRLNEKIERLDRRITEIEKRGRSQ